MPSLFPPPLAPALPQTSSLLISGGYHPSAPVHLALSSRRAIIISPSQPALVSHLHKFNDAYLSAESGKGSMSELTSKIEIFYPPSPAHLCMFLSLLRVTKPGDEPREHSPVPQKTVQPTIPSTVIIVEPSQYFWNEDKANPPLSPNSLLASYLNLLNRVFLCLSGLTNSSSEPPPSLVLFDSQLEKINLPGLEEQSECAALLVVERLFSCVGIFEEDSSFIPSSQSSERNPEEGNRKQLRYYYPDKGGAIEIQIERWVETVRPSLSGEPETSFNWETRES